MVEHDSRVGSPTYLPRINRALDSIEQKVADANLGITQFSDSILVSSAFIPSDVEALVSTVRELQRLLVEQQIVVRGGIDFGRHYAEGDRLFSQALVKAYELESVEAKAPRILVSDNLLDWCLNHESCDTALLASLRSSLLRDRDGKVFVDYLDSELLTVHAGVIRETLKLGERGNPNVLTKAHWLIDYHEYAAARAGVAGLNASYAARFQTLSGP